MTRTWSKTPPQALVNPEGDWYWWRPSPTDRALPIVVTELDDALHAIPAGVGDYAPVADIPGEWLGPITPEDVARADANPCLTKTDIDRERLARIWHGDALWQDHQDARVGRLLREIGEATTIGYFACAVDRGGAGHV